MEMQAVILTKSRMYNNSCVAAYSLNENRLVRFVSDFYGSPIPREISDNFHLLDVVSVNVIRECPRYWQTENLWVDCSSFSVKGKYQPGIEEIYRMIMISPPPPFSSFVEHPGPTLRCASRYDHSLELVRVPKLSLFLKPNSYGELKVKANFNEQWDFSVTDGDFENTVLSKGSLEIRNAYMMVSIPTRPINSGLFYKLIAAIYPRPSDILEGWV